MLKQNFPLRFFSCEHVTIQSPARWPLSCRCIEARYSLLTLLPASPGLPSPARPPHHPDRGTRPVLCPALSSWPGGELNGPKNTRDGATCPCRQTVAHPSFFPVQRSSPKSMARIYKGPSRRMDQEEERRKKHKRRALGVPPVAASSPRLLPTAGKRHRGLRDLKGFAMQ